MTTCSFIIASVLIPFAMSFSIHLASLALPSSPQEISFLVYETIKEASTSFDYESVLAAGLAEVSTLAIVPALKGRQESMAAIPLHLMKEKREEQQTVTPSIDLHAVNIAKISIHLAGIPQTVSAFFAALCLAYVYNSSHGIDKEKFEQTLRSLVGNMCHITIARDVIQGMVYVILHALLRLDTTQTEGSIIECALHICIGAISTTSANILTGKKFLSGSLRGGLFFGLYELYLHTERSVLPDNFQQELIFEKMLDAVEETIITSSLN